MIAIIGRLAVILITTVAIAGCGSKELDGRETRIMPTGFQATSSGSSSSFDISFRPVGQAVDYELTMFQTETSVMPLETMRWSNRLSAGRSACVPGDERDYCIRVGEGLRTPYWFSITAIFPDREIEGERFCFHFHALRGEASECPEIETQGWRYFERGGVGGLEKADDVAENLNCEYREDCK